MSRFLLCSCAFIVALPLWVAHAASAPSTGPYVIDFAVVPGKPLIAHERPQFSFNLVATPGQPLRDIVAVANGSKTKALTVKLSVSDARTPGMGAGLSFGDPGIQRQIGRWTQLNTMTVTVPPNAATMVPVTMRIPSSARPGDYEGSIAATTVSGLSYSQGRTHTILHFTKRCLIYLRVLGNATAGLQITKAGLVKAQHKSAVLAITLKNTGTVIDRPTASAITFVGLQKSYQFHLPIGAVTGGAVTMVEYGLSRAIPAGMYNVHIAIGYLAQPTYPGPYRQLQATWTGTVVVPAISG